MAHLGPPLIPSSAPLIQAHATPNRHEETRQSQARLPS